MPKKVILGGLNYFGFEFALSFAIADQGYGGGSLITSGSFTLTSSYTVPYSS